MPKRVSLADRLAQEAASTLASHLVALTMPSAPTAPSALWGEEQARQEVVALDVTQIMPRARQPRTIFDQSKLEELAGSIREHGIIQPIIVRPIALTKWEGHARRYELIAGERRWRASMLAERTTIPALIRTDTTDHGTLIELALIENIQRADLHPLEEALAFGIMRDELDYSVRRIGDRLGRSKGYVENRLKLLDLDADLQQLVTERPDTLIHVGELAKVANPATRAELVEAVRQGLSYTETQARVRQVLTPVAAPEVSLRKDTHDPDQGGEHGGSLPSHAPSAPEVSLRKDTHDPNQPDREHGGSLPSHAPSAPEVSLRKDTHDPDQPDRERAGASSSHAPSATEVSLRKDTNDADQDREHAGASSSQAAQQPRTIDEHLPPRAEHVPQQNGEHGTSPANQPARQSPAISDDAPSTPAPNHDDQPLLLSTQERTSLMELSSKLEVWLNHPARLAPDDWRLLAPILQRLRDVSDRLGQ